MKLVSRSGAAGLAMAAVLAVGSISLVAQEPAKSQDPPKTGKRSFDPARRVPNYFDQIGLSPEQRDSIYKVRAKHMEKISALRKQLDEAEAQMLAECETVLTDSQRKLLADRRAAAKSKARAKREVPAETKAAVSTGGEK